MTDLNYLFKKRVLASPSGQTISNSRLLKMSQRSPAYRDQKQFTSNLYSSLANSPQVGLNSKENKRVITYNNLEAQLKWYANKYLIQCSVKIILFTIMLLPLYYLRLLNLSTFFTLIVFSFFLTWKQYCVFQSINFSFWIEGSFILTAFVLTQQIFISLLEFVSKSTSTLISGGQFQFLHPLYISVLVVLLVYCLPILTQESAKSSYIVIMNYFKSFLDFAKIIYKLKVLIVKIYGVMVVATFLFMLKVKNWRVADIGQSIFCFKNVYFLVSDLVTFCLVTFFLHFYYMLVSPIVQLFLISILYSQKNKGSKIPFILELLKLSRSEDSKDLGQQQTIFDSKRQIKRKQAENIYLHCLTWIENLTQQNPTALQTKITSSKFYESYYDLFKQFIEEESTQSVNCLFGCIQKVNELIFKKKKCKGFQQDVFYWAKNLSQDLNLWRISVLCCRRLRIFINIINLIKGLENRELKSSSVIGRSKREIQQSVKKLYKTNQLNGVISAKMEEFHEQLSKQVRSQ